MIFQSLMRQLLLILVTSIFRWRSAKGSFKGFVERVGVSKTTLPRNFVYIFCNLFPLLDSNG